MGLRPAGLPCDKPTIYPYYLFAMYEEYKDIQCGMMKNGMKMYYDNILKEDITALHFLNFKNGNCVQKLMASMPNHQVVREWELLTPKDMK